MLVKKTKTGKFSITLSNEVRSKLWTLLVCVCEDQSVKQMFSKLKNESEIMAYLNLHVLEEILTSKNFCLQAQWDVRMIFKRSEAIAIMWLLRDEELPMLELKSTLHQTLS